MAAKIAGFVSVVALISPLHHLRVAAGGEVSGGAPRGRGMVLAECP
jgi:hypothetical protein